MKLKMAYDDFMQESNATGLSFRDEFGEPEVSLAHQSFAEEVDINTIVKRFGLSGELPENPRPPLSGDFAGVVDFKTALDAVTRAQSGFMEFPAALRARFENDPQRMLKFLDDGKNRDEAVALGIVSKPPEVTRDAVMAIDDLAAKLVVPKPAA